MAENALAAPVVGAFRIVFDCVNKDHNLVLRIEHLKADLTTIIKTQRFDNLVPGDFIVYRMRCSTTLKVEFAGDGAPVP